MRFNVFLRKKVLSLVLCVAVMLSVMVLGTGAAFSDQDQIENTEAVDACSALNIIGGYEDGSFHPERNIKRSEITKMICVALNGGKDPNVGTNITPTFSDVRGTSAEWAEGYIESCVAQGIVSGVGGGRFAPDGNVTGSQLAKMLLVSLGYNADNEGFTGNAWETNVNVRAAQKHLYDGLENVDVSAAVTRDQAAQMVWNALQAYEVEYKTTLVTDENGNLATQIVVEDKLDANFNRITLLRDKYEAYVNVGTLTTVDGKNLSIAMNAADEADSDQPTTYKFTKVGVDYSSLLGQKVKVVFTKSSNVLSVFATDSNTVYTVAANGISKDDNRIKFDGNSYGVELTNGGIKTYINGVESDPTTLNELDNNTLNPNMYTLVDSDNNGKIDTLSVKVYHVAQVTYAASDKIIANGVTYRYADHNIADGIAKDDWIVITENLYNENKDIVKADVQTGTLNGIRLDQNVTPYFDGVGTDDADTYNEYQIGDTWFSGGEDLVQDNAISENDLNAVKAGDTVDYVAVNGIVFYVKKSTGDAVGRVADVAMVVAKNNNNLKDEVKIAFFDGTTETVKVDTIYKADGTKGTFDKDLTEGVVYEYSVSGGEYSFEPLKPGVGDGNEKYENYYGDLTYRGKMTEADLDGTGDSYTTFDDMVIDNNAQVLLYLNDGNDVKQITGKQFKTMAKTNVTNNTAVYGFSGDMNGLDRIGALAVTVDSFDNLVKTWTNYGYIVTKPVKTGNNTIEYTIWTGKENVVVQEEKSNITDRDKGTVLGFDALTELTSAKASGNPTHLIEGAEKLVASTSNTIETANITFTAITDSNASTVQFAEVPVGGSGVELDVAGTVMYIDSSASDDLQIGLAEGSIRDAQKDDGKYLANALVIGNGDDIELLIVDQGQYLANDIYKGYVVGTDTVYGDTAVDPEPGPGEDSSIDYVTASGSRVNADGDLIFNLSVTQPEWAADTATYTVTYDVIGDGKVLDTYTATSLPAGSSKVTNTAADFGLYETVSIELKSMVANAVKVRFFNGTTELTLGTGKQVATSNGIIGTSGEQLDVTANWLAGKVSAKADYTIKGATGGTLSGTGLALTNASGVATKANVGSSDVKAIGTGYIDVVFSNVTDSGTKYTLAIDTEITGAKALSLYGITGLDKDTTLTLTADPATAVNGGTYVAIKGQLSAAGKEGTYTVTIKDGDTVLATGTVTASDAQIGSKFALTKNLTITKDMVTVTKVPSVQLTDVEIVSADGVNTQLLLTFNQDLDTTDVVTDLVSGSFTWAGGSNQPSFVSAEFKGTNQVLLICGTNALDAENTLTISGITGANGATILTSCNDKVTFTTDTDGNIVVDKIVASV